MCVHLVRSYVTPPASLDIYYSSPQFPAHLVVHVSFVITLVCNAPCMYHIPRSYTDAKYKINLGQFHFLEIEI